MIDWLTRRQHLPKGYVRFAMAFSVFVETLSLRMRNRAKPVASRHPYTPEGQGGEGRAG